jgi:DNA-binding PadR family transcriptional regulator
MLDISNMDMSVDLKPAAFHILLALAEKDAHGYAVMQAVREQSAGRIPIQTGSFYRHLGTLIDDGLVMEAPAKARAGDDPRRGAYYRLTARGRQVLAAEKQRLTDLVAAMSKIRVSPKRSNA